MAREAVTLLSLTLLTYGCWVIQLDLGCPALSAVLRRVLVFSSKITPCILSELVPRSRRCSDILACLQSR